MYIIKQTEKFAKKMKWYDFSLLKSHVLFFTLFLVTVWPDFRNLVLGIEWNWFLTIAMILWVPLAKKFFSS